MRATRTGLFWILLLLVVTQFVYAQRVDEIEIGETKEGVLTANSSVVSYFFDAGANQVITFQLVTASEGFTPVLMVATSDNNILGTYSASAEATTVGGTLTMPEDGSYFAQVQGANGTRGEFTLSLIEGDLALPTSAAPTAALTPISREPLPLDTITQAQLSDGDPEKQYTFSSGDVPLVVQVIAGSAEAGFGSSLTVTLANAASREPVGSYQATLIGGAFIVPPSSGEYVLIVHHVSGPTQSVSISLFAFGGVTFSPPTTPTAQPTPTLLPTETPLAEPTAISPEDVDILLRWGNTFLTVSNVSGSTLDIRTLAFAGDNRRADMAYWLASTPELNLSAFPATACGGFRPLAYPEVPPLPPDCGELAAWWSADIVFFWGGTEFEVLFNGLVVATCQTTLGQCGVDLPGV